MQIVINCDNPIIVNIRAYFNCQDVLGISFRVMLNM